MKNVKTRFVSLMLVFTILLSIVSFTSISANADVTGKESSFCKPLKAGNILTQSFGNYYGGYHLGVDYGNYNNAETDVIAITDGVVYSYFPEASSGGWGNFVILKHVTTDGKTYYSGYGHMKKDSVVVKIGDTVECGTKLGIMGSTGNSNGNHVHLLVFRNANMTKSFIPAGYTSAAVSGNSYTASNGTVYYNPIYVINTKGTCIYGTATVATGSSVPVLSVRYNVSGGSIDNSDITHDVYKVNESAGLNLRSDAGTSYPKVSAIPYNASFVVAVGETKVAGGYTWGKTTYNGVTGWAVISDFVTKTKSIRGGKYYVGDGVVYSSSDNSVYTDKFTQGINVSDGFADAETLGLTKENCSFAGWSLSPSGTSVIASDVAFKPEDLVPELTSGSKTITVYAVWQSGAASILTVSYNANGGEASGDYYVKDSLIYDSAALGALTRTVERESSVESILLNADVIKLTKENCVFAGWSLTPDGFAVINGDVTAQTIAPELENGNASVTLYAVWHIDNAKEMFITSTGAKTVYTVGESVDASKIVLTVKTDSGYQTVNSGFTVTPSVLSNEGQTEIIVEYAGLSESFCVTVTKPKTASITAAAKADDNTYYLPNTSAARIIKGVYKGDVCLILCSENDFYLALFPYNASSASLSNGFLSYIPKSTFGTPSAAVPSSTEYFSMNPSGTANATAIAAEPVRHRPDTSSIGENGTLTQYENTSVGQRIAVLFELNGYYCIKATASIGFVPKASVKLDRALTGISASGSLSCVVGDDIDKTLLTVNALYSDGTSETLDDYGIILPETAQSGFAAVTSGSYTAFVPVTVENPNACGITVETMPEKLMYALGEEFDGTGLTLNVSYNNGTSTVVTEGISYDCDLSFTGYRPVHITYEGMSTDVYVTVYEKPVFELANKAGSIGETVFIPVYYYSSEELNVLSMSASFGYDNELLLYRGYTVSENIDESRMVVNITTNGRINIAYANDEPIANDCTILVFEFTVVADLLPDGNERECRITVDSLSLFGAESQCYAAVVREGSISSLGYVKISYSSEREMTLPEFTYGEFGNEISVSDITASSDGYVLIGWATEPDSENPVYYAKDKLKCTENTTLYAVWALSGDIDRNGVCDSADLIDMAKYLAGMTAFNRAQSVIADVDMTNQFDSADLITVAQYLADMTPSLPIK